jgi:hypothetical protein
VLQKPADNIKAFTWLDAVFVLSAQAQLFDLFN